MKDLENEIEMKCTLRTFENGKHKPALILNVPEMMNPIINQKRVSSYSLLMPPKPNPKQRPAHLEQLAHGISQRFHSFGSIPLRRKVSDDSWTSNESKLERRNSLDPSKSKRRNSLDQKKAIRRNSLDPSKSTQSDNHNLDRTKLVERQDSLNSLKRNNDRSTTQMILSSEITMILMDCLNKKEKENESFCLICITKSKGCYKFILESKNSYDILTAFLKNSIPPKRWSQYNHHISEPLLEDSETKTQSDVDMDCFTSKEIQDWIQTESISQKWKRRANKFSSRVNESKYL